MGLLSQCRFEPKVLRLVRSLWLRINIVLVVKKLSSRVKLFSHDFLADSTGSTNTETKPDTADSVACRVILKKDLQRMTTLPAEELQPVLFQALQRGAHCGWM